MNEVIGTVPAIFKRTAEKYGERVAMRKKEFGLWHDISWNEYYRLSSQVGAALISMGLNKGECVSIIGDNCPEWVIADMGVQCSGGVAVGVYSTNAWPQAEYVIQNSESRFFFVENEEQLDKWFQFRDNVPMLKKVIVWDLEGLRHFNDPMVMTFEELLDTGKEILSKNPSIVEDRAKDITPDDLSVLIYTSGTTGPPKGAMLTHRNVTWMAKAVTTDNRIYDTDEVMSFLPLCHIFERLFSVFVHITHAYTVNFIENLDTVTDNMREISPTVGYAVPRIWEKYLSSVFIKMSDATWFKKILFGLALKIGKQRATLKMSYKNVPAYLETLYQLAYLTVFRKLKERLGFERLRVAYSGAAPISPDVLLFFQSIGVNLIEGYGQTEGTGVTCASRVGMVKLGTVGPPLTGTEIKIADDGEILVKSDGVFKGYYKNPDSTAETLKDGWLCSGDVGIIDDDGHLKITDRKKDIIVTAGGKNITPQYIENKLKFSPYINDAIVIGDKRKFISALIAIDEDNVVKYAQDHKVQFSTYKDLTQNSGIIELIQKEVEAVNETLSRVEQIKKFKIIPKKLYEEDGEVTPTMKVKRKYVNEAFKDLIESMYKR
ncbi:MAG: long-chain fatty acid--CoA ligase [Deltaproteobacteria bacterium CG_4_8_14_3_um_filter_51_11]|nr:long-chain fatty acid--CoA ligase [bacterium]OIP39838.1 MAG: long-chain fatty acid--CoA ligase [Desulfobacteraceae bacterium CG2_30_51_40]PIP45813.1 MAG: long-chain fatty acid--CoA ligase [Deltaproteobacteria bacterium CG23_combo_of_CG06-09_8_20_14_all_51_20]PIW02051.1 MAG: long-chain fatty acid--CoA ligase [Deltaproteobacteria bacterium CG17_big_fil_post_rev_8_21_14_2_50_51_6]PIX20974.1 MAG: long-chain fatty acid--CoA ligase [Deltaproteobacteria bacterium CG_4_8_14_3_um_filter_51_11]PIY233